MDTEPDVHTEAYFSESKLGNWKTGFDTLLIKIGEIYSIAKSHLFMYHILVFQILIMVERFQLYALSKEEVKKL